MNFKNERLMMSEEEARNRAKELLNENQVDLLTKYMFLEQQCKKQKEAIDKIQIIITNMQSRLIEIKPYQSYVVDGNIIRNMTKKIEDILNEVSE